MATIRWVIVTGEYPPVPGGVSDYSQTVARALVNAGDEVHVIAYGSREGVGSEDGVQVHPLPGNFNLRSLGRASAILKSIPRPYRLWVQYVPHSYGYKAMNLPFALWLYGRSFRDEIWVMWHEVAFPLRRGQRRKYQFLAVITWAMAFLVARSAKRHFLSVPMWQSWLTPLLPKGTALTWLPVFSNFAQRPTPRRVAEIRGTLGAPDAMILGHFGTYLALLPDKLMQCFPPLLLSNPHRRGLFMGRNSREFVESLIAAYPQLRERVIATGSLEPEELVNYLAACDLVIEPFPDGVTARRTSLMVSLALGFPLVTTQSATTEPVWGESGGVALAPVDNPKELIAMAEHLLADQKAREELGRRGTALYEQYFKLDRTISILQNSPA